MDPTLDHGSHVPGGTHRQAPLRDELAGDDLDLTPRRDEIDAGDVPVTDDLLDRSELATFLLPSAFPASAVALVATARDQGAPPEILDRLEQLPPATYHTVQEVWVSLGGATETRASTHTGAEAAPARVERVALPRWVDGLARAAGQMTERTVRVMLGVPVLVLTRATRRRRH